MLHITFEFRAMPKRKKSLSAAHQPDAQSIDEIVVAVIVIAEIHKPRPIWIVHNKLPRLRQPQYQSDSNPYPTNLP